MTEKEIIVEITANHSDNIQFLTQLNKISYALIKASKESAPEESAS